jgi:two-component system, sensor histidine kinase and response regulator
LSALANPIELPVSIAPAPPVAAGKGRGTLLIVDDEEGPLKALRLIFNGDYDLLVASDGETAVNLAHQQKIDVAILDIRMAGMDGIAVLEHLKQVDPSMEVIMLTAYETIDTVRQAMRLGACDYLNKPFDITVIRSTVAAAMERRGLSSEVHSNAEKLRALQGELRKHEVEQEMMRARGEIYASIIHEINNPLTVISALIQGLDQEFSRAARIEGADLEMVKDRLKRITRQVSLCIEISRRHLSALRQGATNTHPAWVNQVLTDLAELMRAHPAALNNQLVITPLLEDLQVSMNGMDLVQVLLNLVINAFQSTPQRHRVEVRAETLDGALNLEAFRPGPEDLFINQEGFRNKPLLLALSVQDSGPGIAPEVLPHIFEPYFTTRQRGQNVGLGLTIVQRFVKQAAGAIHVHSQVGRGTIVTLYLGLRHQPSTLELGV